MGKIGDVLILYNSEEERHRTWRQLIAFEEQLRGGHLCYPDEKVREVAVAYLEYVDYVFDCPENWASVLDALFRRCLLLEKRVIGRDSDVERLAKRT